VDLRPVRLFELQRDALVDVFWLGGRFDHHGRFLFWFAAEQTVEHHHAAS
jgi:hypothetical protein